MKRECSFNPKSNLPLAGMSSGLQSGAFTVTANGVFTSNVMSTQNVPIPTTHPLEVKAWRCPNGSKLVELIDATAATWDAYCADLAKRSITRKQVMQSLPQTPSQVWSEISGKAHLYKTARIIRHVSEYEFVTLLSVEDGTFSVRRLNGDLEQYACNELTDYCL